MRILFLAPTFQTAGGEDLYEVLLSKLQNYSSRIECLCTNEYGVDRRIMERPRRSSHTQLKRPRKAAGNESERPKPRDSISARAFTEILRDFDIVFAVVDINCTLLGVKIALALAEGKPVVLLRRKANWLPQPSYKLLLDWHKIGGARATFCEYADEADIDRALQSYFLNVVKIERA